MSSNTKPVIPDAPPGPAEGWPEDKLRAIRDPGANAALFDPLGSGPSPRRSGFGRAGGFALRTPRNDGLELILRVLAAVPDPEIPALSVLDLGIVREIGERAITITPTYTGCPATFAIEQSIRRALDEAGFAHISINTTLSPPWTSDWISDEGREKLRAYGIAPPPRGAGASALKNETPAECPLCRSHDTEELSRFGSTPCKALWRCKACAEPFDRFKCH